MFSRLASSRAWRYGPTARVLRDLSLPQSLEWAKLPATPGNRGCRLEPLGNIQRGPADE
jgi:hypothetical protein